MQTDEQDASNRVRWRCRRGMLELDSILTDFFDRHYHVLSFNEKALFEQLLQLEDQQLFQWFLSENLEGADDFIPIIQLVRELHP